ncbi:MAG: hypothetical protein K0S78_5774 [Thermomicrobiales bacterium]|jgi:hypothetical protein|nr:hypothetical protein [Thermomicrobiales bacterium]
MDGTRFDAWTRRRLGLVAGGIGALLLGLDEPHEAGAGRKGKKSGKKRRRKRKRCKKLLQPCTIGGKKCCRGNSCEPINGGQFCCKPFGKSCSDGAECCSDLCLTPQNTCSGLG